jgi:hypothetical protein
MGLLDLLFGRRSSKGAAPNAGPGDAGDDADAADRRFSLQLLFERAPSLTTLTTDSLTRALRSYHRSLRAATFEVDPSLAAQGNPAAQARWDGHVVEFVGFDVPIPADVLARCVDPAHYAHDRCAAVDRRLGR